DPVAIARDDQRRLLIATIRDVAIHLGAERRGERLSRKRTEVQVRRLGRGRDRKAAHRVPALVHANLERRETRVLMNPGHTRTRNSRVKDVAVLHEVTGADTNRIVGDVLVLRETDRL